MQKETENKTSRDQKVNNAFGRLLVWAFGMCWAMIVFKAFRWSYMKDLPWLTVCIPLIFFLLCSLTYIILSFSYFKYFKYKESKMTEEQIRLIKRRGHLAKKPTIMKENFHKALMLLAAAIITFLIIHYGL